MAERKVELLKRVARLVQSRGKSRPFAVALPMERLVLNQDTVGHVGLELTALPNWKSFERYAEELLRKLDGHVVEKGCSVDMHLWNVEIENIPLRLVYEDFPSRICLESSSEAGDLLVRNLQKRLLSAQTGQEARPL